MSQSRKLVVAASVVAALISLVAASAQAQQGGGGGRRGGAGGMGGQGNISGGLFVLMNEQVQKELELVAEQKDAVKKLSDAFPEQMRGLRDLSQEERDKKGNELREQNEKKVAEILLPPQLERFKQIELQVRGTGALADKEVGAALGLSEEQKQKLTSIREESQAKRREAFQAADGNRETLRAKGAELAKAADEQMLSVLTSEQKSKFEQMKGKKIDVDLAELRMGRFGGQGGGGQGGGGRRGGQGAGANPQ